MKKQLSTTFLVSLLLLLSTAFLCASLASAEMPPYSFRTEWARLSAEDAGRLPQAPADATEVAVLWLCPEEGYYTYAHEPGDEGMPLTVTPSLGGRPVPADTAQVRYVPGTPVTLPDGGVSRHLEGPAPVFLLLSPKADAAMALDISLLACSSRHCYPVDARTTLAPRPQRLEDASSFPWFQELLESTPSSAPEPSATALQPAQADAAALISLLGQGSRYASMLPPASGGMGLSISGSAISPQAAPAAALAPAGGYDFAPQALEGSFHIDGWASAAALGLVAGLLLNVMPCVLPVLTMKFSILLDGSASFGERIRGIREHALFFALGIVAWFTLLAVLTAFTGLLWGELFQSAEVVFAMLIIVFCMGLSMFGVFHLPVLDLQARHSSSPKAQAFATGMFTTLLATPCSGPLLGGVLAWGITKPLPVLVTVFAATGFGMALPYAALACFPRLVRFLPRPGAWLSIMERVLGFLLMATALYLFSLLPAGLHIKTLATLLTASAAAWIWGCWGSLRGTALRRLLIASGTLGAVLLCSLWTFRPVQEDSIPWVGFSAERFRADLGRKAMLVEFTADWCPTCKVLEQTVLAPSSLLPVLEAHGLTPVKVDMTTKDERQQELLRALDSASIPLLAVFPEGKGASRPVILRDIYSLSDIEQALRQAGID